MNVIVLGAGAIGSAIAYKLAAKHTVTLIGRKKHVDLINSKGLKVSGADSGTFRVKAQTSIRKIEENTVIFLSTKVHDGAVALSKVKKLIRKDTVIVCMQNGLGVTDVAKKAVSGKCAVLRGITMIGAVFLEPGNVYISSFGLNQIETHAKAKGIVSMMKNSGLESKVERGLKKAVWKKVIFNCCFNPVTAILRVRNNVIAKKELDALKKSIISECLAVAKKNGVTFREDFLKLFNSVARKSTNYSSTYQDLEKGKKTEIDYLNGAVSKLGKKYGITTPVNDSLVAMIKVLEGKK